MADPVPHPKLPPGARYPTNEEMAQLMREPDPYCTTGPYVGGWLCIGYRGIPLTEDEAAPLFGPRKAVTRLPYWAWRPWLTPWHKVTAWWHRDRPVTKWPSLFAQFWRLIGPQRHQGVRRCPYLPCGDPDCTFWHRDRPLNRKDAP